MPVDRNDPDFDGEVTPAQTKLSSHRPPGNAPAWALQAYAEYARGVHEIAGDGSNPRIVEYLKTTSLATSRLSNSDETPWCSAFVCWCIEQSGLRSTRSASARSWMRWGTRKAIPAYGDIVVFWRGGPQAVSGHVGFYAGEEGSDIWVLGGNQHNSVSFARYPKARLLGYRVPSVMTPPK